MTFRFSNSAHQVAQTVQANDWAKDAYDEAARRFRRWEDRFDDRVQWLSGWAHNFSCPSCATQIPFRQEQRELFLCPHCGAEFTSQDHREAWVFYYRYESSNDLTSAAVLALLGDQKAKDYIIRFVDFYAAHYQEFPVHGRWVGKGKITGQELDEAVWVLAVLRALEASGIEIPQEKRSYWYDQLFHPVAQLLLDQLQPRIHNIELWMLSAIGAIAVWSGDRQLLTHVLDKDYGIRQQVAKGYTADGFWYEGSTHYHFYTTEGLTEFLGWYALVEPEDSLFRVLEKCYAIPMQLSQDGWSIPSTNDGWFPLDVSTYFRQIQRAARVIDSPLLRSELRLARQKSEDCLRNPESLLFAEAFPQEDAPTLPERIFMPQTHFGVIRQPLHTVLRSGILDTSHMHEDFASIMLDPFSRDLGTPGYGNPLTSSYYRTTFSHNSFTVNGQSQPNRLIPNEIRQIPDGFQAIVGPMSQDPESAYYGVCCTRTLTAKGDLVLDRMELTAPKEVTFDWLFHASGDAALPLAEGAYTFEYPHFTKGVFHGTGTFRAEFTLEGKKLILETENREKGQIVSGKAPGNPADELLTLLMIRQEGTRASFEVQYRIRLQ